MNSPAAITPTIAPPVNDREAGQAPPRSWLARLMIQVFGQWSTRVGLAWLCVLVMTAVLAPLLANSHPILMKSQGRWSSPLMAHLTPTDVTLFVAAISAGVLGLIRVAVKIWLWWLAVVLVIGVIFWMFIQPPQAVVYSKYREAQAAGQVEFIMRTPVPYSPTDRLRDQPESRLLEPGGEHWAGTTAFGEDLLSRMIHASRVALATGFIATGIAVVIGVIIGGLMGYFSGWVDLIGMRLVEVFSAIPTIFLLIMFVAFYGRNLYLIMMIIGLTNWVGYAVFVRAEFLKLRRQDFVAAAQACGLPLWSILFRHILPNGVSPVLVNASFGVASAILLESTLSFLGLGLVEEPSWGQLLEQARGAGGSFYWWIAVYPGAAIFLTVLSYNLIGEALRDALDPRLQKAGL